MMKAVQGEGLPRLKSPFEHGNLFILLNVEFPATLDAQCQVATPACSVVGTCRHSLRAQAVKTIVPAAARLLRPHSRVALQTRHARPKMCNLERG
eukprot:2028090-Pleurochrysis_carterae.AAC.1